jgi:hypothetical protein
MQIQFVFGVSGFNSTFFPGCSGTDDWYTISPTNFANAGYVATAYVRYSTPWGVVVNTYRYTYNGNGIGVGNVTVQEVARRSIYKTIETQRIITYTDGCPPTTCTNTLAIPQQPNDPCTHFVAFVTNVNLGSPCNGAGLSASTINASGTLTYQWKYNGSNLIGETTQFLCMVGRPSGTYCVLISDGTCTEEVCIVVQPPCALSVNITSSGNILTATLNNCSGTITRQWQRWNGTSWVNVGTNSNTYDTGGLAGEYRINVTCSGPPICTAIGLITFTPPCNVAISISVSNLLHTATVTGCNGASITYVWERWNNGAWLIVQQVTTTSTTNTYTPTLSGLYRVTALCLGCAAQTTFNTVVPGLCDGFSVGITGSINQCVGTSYTYNRTILGGTPPFTHIWRLNGVIIGTGSSVTITPSVAGTSVLSLEITDFNACVQTGFLNVNASFCCGMTSNITPNTLSVCQNESATFTASSSGGTAPINYSWTTQLPPSVPIAQGTGTSKTFNFATTGTYTVQVTATDANNCTSVSNATLTVTTCTNCACTPSLTLNGCVLTGSFLGAGCGNFTYQLQYSASGTGWGVVASGSASGSFTHTPTVNGFYRLIIIASGCQGQSAPDVSVTCVTSCGCTPVTLSLSGCELSWGNLCSGYVANLQTFNGTSWINLNETSPYTTSCGSDYRVEYSKSGCANVYSNTVTVPNSCNCTYEIKLRDPVTLSQTTFNTCSTYVDAQGRYNHQRVVQHFIERTCGGVTTIINTYAPEVRYGTTNAFFNIPNYPVTSFQINTSSGTQTINVPTPNGDNSTSLSAYINGLGLGFTTYVTGTSVRMNVLNTNTAGFDIGLTYNTSSATFPYVLQYAGSSSLFRAYIAPCGTIIYNKTAPFANRPTYNVASYNSVTYGPCTTSQLSDYINTIDHNPIITCGCQ